MKYHIVLSLLIALLVISCTSNKLQNDDVLAIELIESKDFLPLSSFISDLEYLELEVSEVNLEIGEIKGIKELGDDLIIRQRKAGEISLIRFTKEGKFINEIVNNKKGKVVNPTDIILYNNDYAVLGENGIHIISKTGKYKKQICAGEMGGSKFLADRDLFKVINEGPAETFLSEYSTVKSKGHINPLDERLRKLIYTSIASVGKGKHLVSSFNNTVFKYENGKLQEKYIFKSEAYPTLSEVWKNVGDLSARETMRYIFDTQNVLVRNYLENDERIFMTYWLGSLSTTLIINKKDWTTLYYGRGVNDIDGGIWDRPMYLSKRDELYVPFSAYKIGGHKITNKRHKDFEKLQLHIAATGNPVIMKCTLK